MPKSKSKAIRNNSPSFLLLVLCIVLLISFWFFRAKTAEAPSKLGAVGETKLELREGAVLTTDSSIKEIDSEFRQLDILEKEI